MKEKEEWPVSVTRGCVTVKIYRVRSGRKSKVYEFFQLVFYIGGERKVESFTDLTEARARARLVAGKLHKNDVEALALTSEDRWRYLSAEKTLAPLAMTVDAAVNEYAQCLGLLKGRGSLPEAVQLYLKHGAHEVRRRTVPEVVAELVAAKRKEGSSNVHQVDLRCRLTRFAKAFPGDISAITSADIQEWLGGLNLAGKTVNNFHGSLSNLFAFAAGSQRRYVAKALNPMLEVERVKENTGAIEIFTADELVKLLVHAGEELTLFLVICGFAGLRSAEFCKLEWGDVRFEAGCIVVERAKAKTASRRVVNLSDNLKAWLRPYERMTGKVWPHSQPYLYEALEIVTAAASVPWKNNALRHSYISYRVALTNDVNKTALEAGNSPQMIFSNYRAVVLPKEAAQWFAIMPAGAEEVLTLPTPDTKVV